MYPLCWYLSQLESAGRMLKVTGAKLEDSGRYTCLATNAAGEAQQHIRLSVHGKVKLNKAPSQHVSDPGFTRLSHACLYFLCQGSRWRQENIIWFFFCFSNSLLVPQSLPVFPPLETSSTRPSCQAFPLSSSARPQAARYLVRWLDKEFLHLAVVARRPRGTGPSDCLIYT